MDRLSVVPKPDNSRNNLGEQLMTWEPGPNPDKLKQTL